MISIRTLRVTACMAPLTLLVSVFPTHPAAAEPATEPATEPVTVAPEPPASEVPPPAPAEPPATEPTAVFPESSQPALPTEPNPTKAPPAVDAASKSAESAPKATVAPSQPANPPVGKWDTSSSDHEPSKMVLLAGYVAVTYAGLGGGDFEGANFAVKPNAGGTGGDAVFIPELNGGAGFEVGFCMYVICLNYGQNWLDTQLMAIEPIESALLRRLTWELRPSYRVTPHLAPYVAATLDLAWMRLRGAHAVVELAPESVTFDGDETNLGGGGVGLAAGSFVQIAGLFALDLSIGYRWLWFGSINDEEVDDGFALKGWFVRGGPALAF
jgi:hypothetical protein